MSGAKTCHRSGGFATVISEFGDLPRARKKQEGKGERVRARADSQKQSMAPNVEITAVSGRGA